MDDRQLRIRIGLFVLFMLVLLGVLVTLFGSFPDVFARQNKYVVVFEDASGVGEGTPVRRSGVRVGEVSHLRLDNESGEVRVEVLVDQEIVLRQNDRAVLLAGILGGDVTIDFIPARDQPPGSIAEPGYEFKGTRPSGLQALLEQSNAVLPSADAALNDIRRTLKRFDELSPLLEETMREYRDLGKTVRETVPDLRRTNDEIRVATMNWGRLGERLDVLVRTNEEKIAKTLENINETVTRIADTFTEENRRNLSETLKNVRAGTQNLESISRNTDELVKESRKNDRESVQIDRAGG
ncbi:MAG: hypothetical protein KatS3mg105_2934 [Gemmatales bacterium]|nr:MAG: hypothetical protein KatS3mg105_2934 [Gemmatales bacterium]